MYFFMVRQALIRPTWARERRLGVEFATLSEVRWHLLAALLAAIASLPTPARAQDDPIALRLAEARDAYHSELAACRKAMDAEFERRLGLARKKGDIEQVRAVEKEKKEAEGGQLVATVAPERIKTRVRRAETSFENSLKNAAKDYVRSSQDEKATIVEKELSDFRTSLDAPARSDSTAIAAALPVQQPVDLLPMVKLPEHAIRGTWRRGTDFVSCERMHNARCMVPVAIQGGYTITCRFTRRVGGDWIGLILPVESQQCYVFVSGWGGTHSGIGRIDGKELPQLAGTSAVTKSAATPVINGAAQELTVVVMSRNTGCSVTASLNGNVFAKWSGNSSALSVTGDNSVPCLLSPAIGSWDNVVDFHDVELKLDRGARGFRLGDEWNCPLLEQLDAPPKEVAGKCTEFEGRKYFISTEPMPFPSAQALALKLKGRLLTVSSAEENAFIAKQARGVGLWMAGWRPADRSLEWRDERNRPLKYVMHWDVNQPDLTWSMQWNLAVLTSGGTARWHDVDPQWGGLHACIEWGEE